MNYEHQKISERKFSNCTDSNFVLPWYMLADHLDIMSLASRCNNFDNGHVIPHNQQRNPLLQV